MLNLFQVSKEEHNSVLQLLQKSLDRTLLAYQLASEVKTAAIMPGIFNNYDVLRIESNVSRQIIDIRSELGLQRDKESVLVIVQKILNSNSDPVLKFCVAVGIAQEMGMSISPVLDNKTYGQLQDLTARGGRFVDRVKSDMESQLLFVHLKR